MEMRRGVAAYLIVGALIAIIFLLLYSLSIEFTGSAVLEQQTQISFDEGSYDGTEYNGSGIILSSGQTGGYYTSAIFDAGESVLWENLTWTEQIPGSVEISLSSALNEENEISEVYSQDGVFYQVEMENSTRFYLNFSSALDDGDVLKMYVKKDKGDTIGVYAQSDPSGDTALGTFTVTSETGELMDVALSMPSQTDAIWLGEGSGSGTDLEEYFDYVYAESDPGAGIEFQVRVCSSVDCSDASFSSADLNNMNLEGQYFQYEVSFSTLNSDATPLLEGVIIGYSELPAIILTLSEPTGTMDLQTGVPIQYSAVGENLTCLYSVETSGGESVITNTTLVDCGESTFDVSSDGDYVFNLYVSNSDGESESATSTFSISTAQEAAEEEEEVPAEEEEPEESALSESAGGEETLVIPTPQINKLSIPEIQRLSLSPEDTEEVVISVGNIGTNPLSDCVLKGSGDFASWVYPDDTKNLNPGDEQNFTFSLIIPEEAELREYTLTISLECYETVKTSDFVVEVFEKKLELNITDVVRTKKDEVRVIYTLKELSGSEQNVELQFVLLGVNDEKVADVKKNETLSANSTEEFRASILINESLLPINETTNETLESELTLNINFNSQIYSSSVQEKITIGAPVGGFAIFEGVGTTGSILILVVVLIVLVLIFFFVRHMRKGSNLQGIFKPKQK